MDNSETHKIGARQWYSPAGVRRIMAASPGGDTFQAFERFCRHNDSTFATVWGVPDIGAALEMVGITQRDFAERVCVTENEAQEYACGIKAPTMYALLMWAFVLDWPLVRFFRGPNGWHPRTRAARRAGLPILTW